MKDSSNRIRLSRRPLTAALVMAPALCVVLAVATSAHAAPTKVPLGTSRPFAVLAGSGITNTGPTTINGDIGTFPTTSISGANSITLTGTNHGGDAVTQAAKTDLVTAFKNAARQGPSRPITANLGNRTLVPGVYNSASSVGLSGTLTLNGRGDPDSVFVFQAGSTLTTASASNVALINGARACNIFWEVGSSATLGTASNFRGTILARTSITVTTGVTMIGRVLARNGAVTLDTDTISTPSCKAATPATTTTTRAVTTTTTTPATSTTTPSASTSTSTPSASPAPGTPSLISAPGPRAPRRSFGLTG
jgi:Ice-binding-like